MIMLILFILMVKHMLLMFKMLRMVMFMLLVRFIMFIMFMLLITFIMCIMLILLRPCFLGHPIHLLLMVSVGKVLIILNLLMCLK
jgi:hypothetical protein